MAYDRNNIFAKILQGSIPCQKIFENNFCLAFHDINPKAPIHALVIPKGSYSDSQDFFSNASADELQGYFKGLAEVVDLLNIKDEGFRLISNCGINGGQEVPHFHSHILAGKKLGPMLSK